MNELFHEGLIVLWYGATWRFCSREHAQLHFNRPPAQVALLMSEAAFLDELRSGLLIVVRLPDCIHAPDRAPFDAILPELNRTSGRNARTTAERRWRYVHAALAHLREHGRSTRLSSLPALLAPQLGEPPASAPSPRTLGRWINSYFEEKYRFAGGHSNLSRSDSPRVHRMHRVLRDRPRNPPDQPGSPDSFDDA